MRVLIALLFLPLLSWSQEGTGFKLWIGFSDKGSITNSTYSASDLLSERSIARREKQNIPIDYTDYPISLDYLSSLKNLNFGPSQGMRANKTMMPASTIVRHIKETMTASGP